MKDYNEKYRGGSRGPEQGVDVVRLRKNRKIGDRTNQKTLGLLQAALIIIAAIALIVVWIKVVPFMTNRHNTDARKKAEAALELINVEEAATVTDYTVFVVEQSGKYYIYWKVATAAGFGLVAYDDEGVVNAPISCDDEVKYPFERNPFTGGASKMKASGGQIISMVILYPGFVAAEDAYFTRFVESEEWSSSFSKDVQVYSFRTGASELIPIEEEKPTGVPMTPNPEATIAPKPNTTPKSGS